MKGRLPLLALTICLLGGCAILPASWFGGDDAPRTEARTHFHASLKWWEAFNDPLLNQLVDQIATQNIDLKIAQARLDESRSLETVSRSGFYPDISVSGAASRANTISPNILPAESSGVTQTIESGGFSASWELDLFGKTRAGVSAAEARSASRDADIDDIYNTVIADVARAVIEWRQAQQTIRETNSLLESQDDQVNLLRTRAKSGLIDSSFAERALAQRAQTSTQASLAAAASKTAQYQIERLLDVKDARVENMLAEAADVPVSVPEPNNIIHVSIEILKDRPDIQEAQDNLLAAQADVKEAEAALWPQITLSSFFGIQSTGPSSPVVVSNPLWSLASAISMPVLNFGRLRGAVNAADARTQQAVFGYEKVTMLALQETKTALSDYLNDVNAMHQQAEALNHRQETVRIARERFDRGLTDMTDLTTAQTELDQATLTMIERRTSAAIAYIRLQKALGII